MHVIGGSSFPVFNFWNQIIYIGLDCNVFYTHKNMYNLVALPVQFRQFFECRHMLFSEVDSECRLLGTGVAFHAPEL